MISIIAVLIGILLPVLGNARQSARAIADLSNIRQLETAHWMYMNDQNGMFIDVGLAHGGIDANEEIAWIKTLRYYYTNLTDSGSGQELLARSPLDDSPHWGPAPAGDPISGASDPNQRRRTSYGVNNYLTDTAPFTAYRKLEQVRQPTATVHFLLMAFEGDFAGADHPHVENWGADANTPTRAANQVQIAAVAGPDKSFQSRSNYGFLDGHAEAAAFGDVYTNFTTNRFDPEVAR